VKKVDSTCTRKESLLEGTGVKGNRWERRTLNGAKYYGSANAEEGETVHYTGEGEEGRGHLVTK